MIRFLMAVLMGVISFQLHAQFDDVDTSSFFDDSEKTETPRVRKYPARLWEISGNGLKQPSYLYGTMHVSKKLAFNLGDTFYKALQSVDVVALELAIDSWLSNIGRNQEDYFFGFNKYGSYGYGYGEFYKNALSFKGTELRGLLKELGSEDYMSNFLLYRQGYESPDYSEKTYVDLYIHQVGKKLNKFCTGLEDFDISSRMVARSNWRDRTFPNESNYNRYPGYYDFGEDPNEKAYREGDLDMIDSLEKTGNPNRHFLKWMLYERNKVMADKIEEIVKTKRLFAAVGCAHLPGDSGVIEFLRKKGFVLNPIYDEVGDFAFKSKQKLETTTTPVTFKKYVSHDGQLSFDLPGIPLDRSSGNTEDIFYADVANGAYYVIKRFSTYSAVNGVTQQKLLKQIDSALYENIPGDITARSKTQINGFPAVDVSNRTKTGETQRHVYIIMPNDVWYIKLSAAGSYAEGKEARDFFKSITVQTKTPEWNVFSPECGGFEAKWPVKVIQNKLSFDTSTNYRGHSTLEYTDNSGNLYFLRSIDLPYYAFDVDTFNMHQIAVNYAFYNEGKVEDFDFRMIQGHQAMETTVRMKNRDLYLHMLLAADGDKYYSLGCFTKSKKAPNGFLESFSFTPYRYKYKLISKYDSLTELEYKRPDWKAIEDQHKKQVEESAIAHREIVYPEGNQYGYSPLSEYFSDTLKSQYHAAQPVVFPSGEFVQISKVVRSRLDNVSNFEPLIKAGVLKKGTLDYQRYRFYTDSLRRVSDSENLAGIEATYKLNRAQKYLKDTLYWKNGILCYESVNTVPGTSWCNANYSLATPNSYVSASTIFDATRGMSGMVRDVMHSIKLDSAKGSTIDSIAFGNLMVKLLSSTDSVDLFRAQDYQWFMSVVPTSFDDTLMSLMRMFDRNKKYGKSYAEMIEQKLIGDDYLPLVSFYMDKFRRSGDTSEIQALMLGNLARMRNKTAMDSMVYWLIEETPLAPENSYSNYTYSAIISSARDTLKLWKDYYARLLPLKRYREYEDAIMSLGIELLDSQFIDSMIFTPIIPELAMSFRDDLKRKKAVPVRHGGYDYYSRYSRSYGSSYRDVDNYEYGRYGNTLFNSGSGSGSAGWTNWATEPEEEYYEDYTLHKYAGMHHLNAKNGYTVPYNYSSSSGNGSGTLFDKARILVKFYHQNPEVEKRLRRIYTLQDKTEKMQFISLYLKHGIDIPDTMYNYYLGQDDSKFGFIQMLKDRKQEKYIPTGFYNEKEMVRAFLYYHHFTNSDSVVMLGKKSVEIEGESGNMYFVKHFNKEEKKETRKENWEYSYVFIGKADTLQTMKYPRYYGFNNALNKKQTIKEIMDMEASKLLNWKHPLWQELKPENEDDNRDGDFGWDDY